MLILGIETSCDETSVALVEDGCRVLASHVASQVRIHARFGGVVPELASRAHIQRLIPMIDACLREAGASLGDPDAVAVTQGPGLVGALLVGVETAKAIAFARRKALIPVHHIAAHLYSPFVGGGGAAWRLVVLDPEATDGSGRESAHAPPEAGQPLEYPYVGLVVSGGHSSLILCRSPRCHEVLGETVDDAAGEAFDKVAKLLDLGYPGGPLIDRVAADGDPARFDLPRPMRSSGNLDFSFSGLKTAVLLLVRELGADRVRTDPTLLADVCASFQEAVVDVLLAKARAALEMTGCRHLAIVGGVACNRRLRAAAARALPHARVVFPPPVLCTDNAAMIAGLAYHLRDDHRTCDLRLNADAALALL
ncbi:MAG: tRNA (adenosine(37)-N6)-threonylcarbamoyltransferase complex transferase subunit TsaD [Candidatus Sumerlaeaceae bacterium]|nr:tRNA (adenosine(37)-N6)-threonylcarbamoyltransferase complex transferase subunit TsaD [Candidatus Sumerlaeaceae bacterium]